MIVSVDPGGQEDLTANPVNRTTHKRESGMEQMLRGSRLLLQRMVIGVADPLPRFPFSDLQCCI